MRARLRDIIPNGPHTYLQFLVQGKAASFDRYLGKELELEIGPVKKRRSIDANKMLWACIGELSAALRANKWDVYLLMLKRYGKYTYILVKPEAVEDMRKSWRESEVIGQGDLNGQTMVQMLCYFGSSTYNSQEFSVILDGVISEMKEVGLQPPASEEMQAAIKKLEDADANRQGKDWQKEQEQGQAW